jgi:hypothetical protein
VSDKDHVERGERMVEFDQIKFALNGYAVPLKEVGDSL